MPPRDLGAVTDLIDWIENLRRRLERGDLASHPPVDVGHGTGDIPADLTISIMLADLDSYDDMPLAETNDPVNVARWFNLLDDFRILRMFVGGDVAGGSDGPRATRDASEEGQPPCYRDRVGQLVRVRLPRDPPCEDLSHTPAEDDRVGELVHCAARPGGSSHP